jgi:hypothetical protein
MPKKHTNKEALIERVLSEVANGSSLAKALKENGIGSRDTWMKWLDESDVLQARYARARESLGDVLAERVLDVVEAAKTGEAAQVAKVKADALRWYAGKVNQRYSDKTELALGNGAGLTIVLGRFEAAQSSPLPITHVTRSLPKE